MSDTSAVFHKIKNHKYGPLFFTLFVFLGISLISLFVFYNGFTINFPRINSYVNSSFLDKILLYVPYWNFSICLSAFLHPLFSIGFVLIISPLLIHRKDINSLYFDRSEKLLVFFSAALLSWELCTYNYNYYLDSAFYFDRIILLLFPFLLWKRPYLSPVYVAMALVYRSQFNYPLEGFELFDKRLLFDVLIMFTSVSYIKLFFKDIAPNFLHMVLCIVASNYFVSGISKIAMSPHGYEWLTQNHLSDFFLNAHQRGWMNGVSGNAIKNIYSILNNGDFLFKIITLIIEIFAFCILINRRWAIMGLSSFIVLHIGIFIAGSMLFWKWIAIDLLLIWILISKEDVSDFYIKIRGKASFVILLSSFIWLRPYTIGWFDTKINQFFTYEAEDDKGQIFALHKNDFNPYHQWIQYDKFLRLLNQKTLPISGFGYTHEYKIQNQLSQLNPDSVLHYIEKTGINNYDVQWKTKYEAFMKSFFHNRNVRGEQLSYLKYIRAPHHLYNHDLGEGLSESQNIIRIRVYLNLTHNLNGTSRLLIKKPVIEINI